MRREDKVTKILCQLFKPPGCWTEVPRGFADPVFGFLQLFCHGCLPETTSTFLCVSSGQPVAPDPRVAPEICPPPHPGGCWLIQTLSNGKGQAEADVWSPGTAWCYRSHETPEEVFQGSSPTDSSWISFVSALCGAFGHVLCWLQGWKTWQSWLCSCQKCARSLSPQLT